jgi:hypothetical protein
MVKQGEIIEVPFMLVDGSIKPHPALVVSNLILDDVGDFFYAILISSQNINPQYTIEIKPEMLIKPMNKQSYFVTHLLDKFTEKNIVNQYNNFIRPNYFDVVFKKIFYSIFGLILEIENE